MKKVSLLMGALGGAMAGYLLSNDKLRDELAKVKSADQAAKIVGKHMSKDGKQIAKEVQEFVKSEDVQKNIKKAKTYATSKWKEARKGMEGMMKQEMVKAKKAAKKAMEA